MNVHRCPECGQRLKTNYCDICMRRVPFGGIKMTQPRDPWDRTDGSSAHRREKGHECVSFGDEKKPKKPSFNPPHRKTADPKKKGASAVAIVLAVLSLLPALFGLAEEFTGSEPVAEPEYSVYEDFVAAGEPGAEDAPKVLTDEIYNADGVRITVDSAGLLYDEYTVFLTIQNETDHKITVSADMLSANGYMLPVGFYQEVKAGKIQHVSLSFPNYELEKAGFKQVGDIEFILEIYDEYTNLAIREPVSIKTDATINYSTMTGIAGIPLYDDENLTVLLQSVSLHDYGDCELKLYLQNHSQYDLNVYSGAIWVNGEEVSGYLWQMLRPNTCAMNDAYIYELDERVDLEIQSLDAIKEITIDLYVDLTDDMELVESFSESITFEPGAI